MPINVLVIREQLVYKIDFFITLPSNYLKDLALIFFNNSQKKFSSTQTKSAISGDIVVWEDNRDGQSHIYYKNLYTHKTGRISTTNSDQYISNIG